jgi:hypothetical protein
MNRAVEAAEARAGESDVVRIETGYETTAASMREYLAGSFPVEPAATREGRWQVVVHTDAGREMSAQRTTSGPVLPRRERRLTGS